MQKGQIFGLQEMLHWNQPSLILVSNGAEILMLSKKLYKKYVTGDQLLHLERTIPLFPSDSKLQKELETTVKWEAFKKEQMNTLVAERRSARIKPRRCKTAHL